MKDHYGRTIDYLRISITDRCNLRCTYCMPESGVCGIAHEEILSYEEIQNICQEMAKRGIKHIKITGGEPLVRKGVSDLIRLLKQIEGIETVTLTTNGILLASMTEELIQAGIDGINISLDTLDEEQYAKITRGGDVRKVLEGLEKVLEYSDITVKINCVLTDTNWEENAILVAKLAKEKPVHVRFIEHMPIGLEAEKEAKPQDIVLEKLEKTYGISIACQKPLGFGPSVYYQFDGFTGKIGFISAISHKFCNRCNRVRLTADGKLRMCLQSNDDVNLKSILRGTYPERLGTVIEQAILKKPLEHHFDRMKIETTSMSQIGG